uniref:Reverse transcriptase domain-containing protein n=1 Tax=Heterorhabditis bacteriophora TaxID=37862 RepID=A0A1I7WEB7_HETBA
MYDIIKDLSDVTVDSPEAMNGVLSTLKSALEGSIAYSLKRKSTDNSLQGSYGVLYGTVRAERYQMVSSRSVVKVFGKDVFLIGDMRAAYLQIDSDVNITSKDSYLKPIFIQIWNSTVDLYGQSRQPQINTSLTTWLPLATASLNLQVRILDLAKMTFMIGIIKYKCI